MNTSTKTLAEQRAHRLSPVEAERIKTTLLEAAGRGCQGTHGQADPERLASGLITAFELVDAATAGQPALGSAASETT